MTLNGFYFTATGVTEYAFYDVDRCVLRVVHTAMPGEPVRVSTSSGVECTLALPYNDSWDDAPEPFPGASFPFLDGDGREVGRLYLLSADHFAVGMPGAALTGRVIHSRLRRSVCLTGLDDALVANVECSFARAVSQERFGEWFPRRYVAEIADGADARLLALAIAAPFVGIGAIDVG